MRSWNVVVRIVVPETPTRVRVKLPTEAVSDTVTVTCVFSVGVTEAGLKCNVTPDGRLSAVRFTGPLKPRSETSASVNFPASPWRRDILFTRG